MLRRRLLQVNKGKYVDNGLVVWYDGKNNLQGGGYSTTTTYWYPYVAENTDILNNCYLRKNGSPTWLTNGGFNDPSSSSTNNYVQNNSSIVFTSKTTAITDFTWIIHVNVEKSDLENLNQTFRFLGESFSGYDGSGRYILECKENGSIFGMSQNTGSKWIESKVSGNSTPNVIRTVAFVRSGSTLTVYVNGQLFGSTGCPRIALINNSDEIFILAGYDSPNNNYYDRAFKGDFYGCVCYRRALSETEVKNMTDYLEDRYYTDEASCIDEPSECTYTITSGPYGDQADCEGNTSTSFRYNVSGYVTASNQWALLSGNVGGWSQNDRWSGTASEEYTHSGCPNSTTITWNVYQENCGGSSGSNTTTFTFPTYRIGLWINNGGNYTSFTPNTDIQVIIHNPSYDNTSYEVLHEFNAGVSYSIVGKNESDYYLIDESNEQLTFEDYYLDGSDIYLTVLFPNGYDGQEVIGTLNDGTEYHTDNSNLTELSDLQINNSSAIVGDNEFVFDDGNGVMIWL